MTTLQLFGWGANNYGQLANGQPCEQLEWPFLIEGQNISNPETRIELGGGHTLLLDPVGKGNLYATGWNNKGIQYKNQIYLQKSTVVPHTVQFQYFEFWLKAEKVLWRNYNSVNF